VWTAPGRGRRVRPPGRAGGPGIHPHSATSTPAQPSSPGSRVTSVTVVAAAGRRPVRRQPHRQEPSEGVDVAADRPDADRSTGPRPDRSWFRTGFQLGLGALSAYLLVQSVLRIHGVVVPALLALVVAVSAEPVVGLLVARGLRRSRAVAAVVVGLFVTLAALLSLLVPPVTSEVDALVKAVPTWLQELHDHSSTLGRLEDRYDLIGKLKQQLSGTGAGQVVHGVLGAGQLVLTTATGVVLVVVLTLYFLAGLPALLAFSLRFVPGSSRPQAAALAEEILSRTGRFMLANVATSIIAGLATVIWLVIWDVPYPWALGVFVGLMDLVPVIGSTIGGVVVSLVALVVSLPVAIATAVFYVFFRIAEDYLIVPRAMKFAVAVHPLVTILAVLAGGALLGLVGALLAIPAAVAVGLLLDRAVFPGIAER